MSNQTQTSTTWGSMCVSRDEKYQTIESHCKGCGKVTKQAAVPLRLSAFEAVKPQHEAGCRFSLKTRLQEMVKAIEQKNRPVVAVTAAPITRLEVVLAAVVFALALLTGAVIW